MLRVLSAFSSSTRTSAGTCGSPSNNTAVEPAAVGKANKLVSADVDAVMPSAVIADSAGQNNLPPSTAKVATSAASKPVPSFEPPPPFSDDPSSYWALGRRENWEKLRALLLPISSKFYVTDAASKAWLDGVIRSKFDSARDPDTGMGVVYEMVSYFGGDDAELMKLVLACGMNPDSPKKHSWRPLHICGSYARLESAEALLMCRPDLTACNHHGSTPLGVARGEKYPEDERFPERVQRRPKIAAIIEQYVEKGFPRLAELACHRDWFAVKNLIRRQVVPKSELTKEKYEGKTALQWAEFHGEDEMAQELKFYTKLCIAAHKPGAKLKKRLKSFKMWTKRVSPPADGHGVLIVNHSPPAVTVKLQNGNAKSQNGHVDELPLSGKENPTTNGHTVCEASC